MTAIIHQYPGRMQKCFVGALLFAACLFALPNRLLAQDANPPAILLADRVTISEADQIMTAQGHVQIFYGQITLNASSIVYDSQRGTISVAGPLVVEDGDGTRIFADFAQLSPDLVDGVIQGARLLLANRLQFLSAEIRRTSGRYTTLYKSVGSSCQVCFDRPVPVWQIRSDRIIHDRQEKTLYFSNATLDVFGLPVFHLPYLRIPDPTVTRATGFLVPRFLSADLYGTGVKTPYYLVLSDQSDATLTPFVTTKGTAILELEYRKWFQSGSAVISGALALNDGISSAGPRGFVHAKADFALRKGFRVGLDVFSASDEDFLRQFEYSTADRLTSVGSIYRYRNEDYFEFGTVVFQSLRSSEDFASVPVVLPELSFRRHVPLNVPGLHLSVGANMLGLVRSEGRDVLRIGVNADANYIKYLASGVVVQAMGKLDINSYQTLNDTANFSSDVVSLVIPTLALSIRVPFARYTTNAIETFEPVFQLVHTGEPSSSGLIPNEDSQQVEFDETNLFSINRYPGLDRSEFGLRANVGANYNRISNSGWNIGATVGQVFRLDNASEFSPGSGLGTGVSDFLGALTLELPSQFRMINRVLFDSDFQFKRAETQVAIFKENYQIDASFLHLDADANAGALDVRNEVALAGAWRFRPNWEISGNARYNLTEHTPTKASGTLTYGSECIKVELSASRSYTTSDNIPPATSYGLTVKLAGFGGAAEQSWPAATCGL